MPRNKLAIVYIVLFVLMSFGTYINIIRNSKIDVINNFVVSYMPNASGVAIYEPETSNTMKCNLTTVNNIIQGMLDDCYSIQKDYSAGYLLDIVLTDGEEQFRILYNRRTRDFLCMSNPFLRSYVPMTYIHGE